MQALVLVDIQNDFLPGGALAVPKGDEVIAVANRLLAQKIFGLVVATQDFHPSNHGSFAANNPGKKPGEMSELAGLAQVMWPNHCVQGSKGADFAAKLDVNKVDKVFQKGMDPKIDSYSGFFDNGKRKSTGLGEYLKSKGVTAVTVLGLATDYCVKFTALDAKDLGLNVTLIRDGARAVDLQPGDGEKAIAEMKRAGITVITADEYIQKRAL